MKKKVLCTLTLIVMIITTLGAQPNSVRNTNLSITPAGRNSGAFEATQYQTSQKIETEISLSEILYSLGNLYTFIDSNYLYDIDTEEMHIALIEAMVNSLGDKYSYYIRPSEAEDFAEETSGTYVGIGTYLTKANPAYIDYEDPETYMVIITSPFPGGPADRAGLRANDMISHVNGEDISELNANEASKLIRGTEGKTITLTVHRGNSVFDITLMPEVVKTPTSQTQLIEDNIGYINISQFNEITYETVYEDVMNLVDDGAESLIIDLRNNGGGIVNSSLSIANMFISEGELLTTGFKKTSNNKDVVYSASSFLAVPESMPIVVLINEGTASASEILTAALKENDRAIVVGEKSFGKGIMQSVIPYMDGFLNITTAHYYTPDGNDIHGVGITPDYIVETPEYTEEEMEAYAKFMETPEILTDWVDKYPEYSKKNIENFAKKHVDSGVPYDLLCLLIRNEYIYSLDYEDRPIADPDFDLQLKKAIEVIKKQ